MSKPQNSGSRFKGLAAVPGNGNQELAAPGVQPVFDGTIASVCELTGIGLKKFMEIMQWAKESDPRVAQFLNVWDALDASEQQARGKADAVREQVGLGPMELLGIFAEVACRVSMYEAQIIAVDAHPSIVEKTIDMALNHPNSRVRLDAQIVLHKAMGFLPTPKGSQTTIEMTQNAAAHAGAQGAAVALPPPELTIRRVQDRFNEARGLPHTPAAALPGTVSHADAVSVEIPEEEEEDGK